MYTYLWHENYNGIWCLGIKLYTVRSFPTQNLRMKVELLRKAYSCKKIKYHINRKLLTDLANSITEICIPKQIPR
jgi:hypothetical protein